ncbi:hypothetical protein [Roseivirga sp.]|uniref:hypothetical protein n=1 Tax=Roseivirga sp. TaxID=1964215 RepID=UPI003B529C58
MIPSAIVFQRLFACLVFIVVYLAWNCHLQAQEVKLDSRIIEQGVLISWESSSQIPEKQATIYRSRNGQAFEVIQTSNKGQIQYIDDSAIFGLFRYFIAFETDKAILHSDTIDIENFAGELAGELTPSSSGKVNLVLGNASTNQKIWFGLLDQNGEYVKDIEEIQLDKQLLQIDCSNLPPRLYIACIMLKDFGPFLYKIDLRGR